MTRSINQNGGMAEWSNANNGFMSLLRLTPPRVRIPSSSAKETHDVSVVGFVFPNALQANLQKYLEAQNGQAKLAWVSCLHRIACSGCWDKIPSSSAKETHDVSVVGFVFPNALQANLQKYLEA